MKTLILVRHAKSSWEFNVIDHERPLNDRGNSDAYLVSNILKNDNLKVDYILCSDALRTVTTANIFISNLKLNSDLLELNHDLYDFSGENLLKTIKSCSNSVNNLLVFGHNHAVTNFVNTYGNLPIDNIPTCGVTIIEFDTNNCNNIKNGKTIKTLFPKDFK